MMVHPRKTIFLNFPAGWPSELEKGVKRVES